MTNPIPYADLPGNADKYSFDFIPVLANSPLAGKHICALGSSVTHGATALGYAVGEYIAARFGCSLTKEAVSGTTLSTAVANNYVERMLANLDPKAHFDLLIVQLSTNDVKRCPNLGEIAPGTDLDAFDTNTITGAMEYIICYGKKTWNCPVVFYTSSYFESDFYPLMLERLKQLQTKYGIGILNLYEDKAFNTISEAEHSLYMKDAFHPTKAGYRDWWGPELEKQLLAYLQA